MCGEAILGPLRCVFFKLEVKGFGGTIRHPLIDFTTGGLARRSSVRTASHTRIASMGYGESSPRRSGLERAGNFGVEYGGREIPGGHLATERVHLLREVCTQVLRRRIGGRVAGLVA